MIPDIEEAAMQFARLVKLGNTQATAADLVGHDQRHLRSVCDRLGIKYRRKNKKNHVPTKKQRVAAIKCYNEAIKGGRTIADAAHQCGYGSNLVAEWARALEIRVFDPIEFMEPWEINALFFYNDHKPLEPDTKGPKPQSWPRTGSARKTRGL